MYLRDDFLAIFLQSYKSHKYNFFVYEVYFSFYFIILPFLAEKYNLDILNYLDRIPEMSKWILNASEKDIDLLFGGAYE